MFSISIIKEVIKEHKLPDQETKFIKDNNLTGQEAKRHI